MTPEQSEAKEKSKAEHGANIHNHNTPTVRQEDSWESEESKIYTKRPYVIKQTNKNLEHTVSDLIYMEFYRIVMESFSPGLNIPSMKEEDALDSRIKQTSSLGKLKLLRFPKIPSTVL